MRALLIDNSTRQKCQKIMAYSESHIYDLANPGVIPGDNPRQTVHLNSYRCVFSITKDFEGRLFRHLSISVSTAGEKYPNPYAVAEIAQLFGFTGWDGKTVEPFPWIASLNKQDRCVIIIQPKN
jgi:hypothetical protein